MDFKKNPKTDFKEVGKLSKEQARQEIDALREGIEYHDYLYYAMREKMETRQRSPRWALAWKFEPKHDVKTINEKTFQKLVGSRSGGQ
jgi:NAD-dependent DNA ligase